MAARKERQDLQEFSLTVILSVCMLLISIDLNVYAYIAWRRKRDLSVLSAFVDNPYEF